MFIIASDGYFCYMKLTFGMHYLLHRLTAKNRHGLHSPFVYKLLDEVIYDFSANPIYTEIEDQRLPDTRKLCNTPRVDQLLYRLTKYFNPQSILKIGTDTGITAQYLRKAAPRAIIYIMEEPALPYELQTIELAYINTTNNPTNLLLDFEVLLPKLHSHSVVIMNSIYQSPETRQAWKQFQANPKVTATVDLFFLGLIFFREGQAKEHFKLKF